MGNLSQQELLTALENGIINKSYIEQQLIMKKREERLKKHPFSIWQGNDGRWYTHIQDNRKGRVLRSRKTKEGIEDLVADYQAGLERSPTIEEVFNEWNDRKLKLEQISKSTHVRNSCCFKRHFSEFGQRKIKNTGIIDWCDFLEEQIPEHKLSAKGFANLKGVTKGIVFKAKRSGYINYTPDMVFSELDEIEIKLKKVVKKDSEEVFDEEETRILMKYFQENQDSLNLILLLLFVTGMRIGEAVALRNEDIGDNYINICGTETRYRENGKLIVEVKDFPKTEAGIRTIVVPQNYEWILKKIKRINPFGEYVFFENKMRFTGDNARNRLRAVCKKTGIPYRSPHKIRKTYVSILLDNNMDQRFVLDQVGHASITTSETFYHRNRKNVAQKQELLDKIAEFG